MKKLKTGDVKRYRTNPLVIGPIHTWAVVKRKGRVYGMHSRQAARYFKGYGHRIARIISIGPKYVTVRISK